MYKMRATKTHTHRVRHNKHTHTHTKRIKIINYFNSGITVTRRRGLARGEERGGVGRGRGSWRGAFIMRTINAAAGAVAT